MKAPHEETLAREKPNNGCQREKTQASQPFRIGSLALDNTLAHNQ
jgi:hypothetical protein